MAEIKIEKRKPILPWIIGLILLALLVFLLVRDNGDAEDAGAATDTTQNSGLSPTEPTATSSNDNAVSEYINYINSGETIDKDHRFINGALERLTRAVEAKAAQTGYTVETDLSRIREFANNITEDAGATTHAGKISQSATGLADVMTNLQRAKFSNLNNEAQEVQQASASIKPEVLTLEQKEPIRQFFEKSGQLLQQMN